MPSQRNNSRAPALGLLAIVVLAYLPILRAGFIWDDDDHVTANEALRSLAGLWRIWTDPSATPQYYPLVHTTFWLEYHVWGASPLGYHVVNVLLHALSAILLWRLLLRLEVPGAWIAAALFAVHPVEVESVAWITERKNVLSTLCYFGSAWYYLEFAAIGALRPAARERRVAYVASLALFAAALLSKTVTCSLPVALLLVLWWKRGRVTRSDIGPLAPFFTIGAALGLTTAWLERVHVGAAGAAWQLTFLDRCLIAGRALWFYAATLVVPIHLAFIYPRWQIDAGIAWQWIFPVAACGVLAALWVARRRIGRGPLVAVLFFVATVSPALGFINVYPMRYSFVADHFQYLAMVGLIALAAAGAASLPRAVPGITIAVLAALTWVRVGAYRDLETLWRDTLARNPTSWLVNNNLGVTLMHAGRWNEALPYFTAALRADSTSAETYMNIGSVLLHDGRLDEAIAYYRLSLQQDPRYDKAQLNLTAALAAKASVSDTLTKLHAAVAASPRNAAARVALGDFFRAGAQFDSAIAEYSEARRLTPGDASIANDLGLALEGKGQMAAAERAYRDAVRLDSNNAAAHFNLARKLLEQRRADDAAVELRAALRLRPELAQAKQLLDLIEGQPPP